MSMDAPEHEHIPEGPDLARPGDSAREHSSCREPSPSLPRPPPLSPLSPLPAPPAIRVRIARDRTAEARATGGFLNLSRLDLVATYPDGSESAAFKYDLGARAALDAAIIAAYFVECGVHHLYLRSAVRPPCALRAIPPSSDGNLWEVPAGLVEPGEDPSETAARELGEELGFTAAAKDMKPLGPWMFPVPAMIAERHVFFRVEVDPRSRATPTEDGSALERAAAICAVPLLDVVEHCRTGAIRDAKTELAARRLVDSLGLDARPRRPRAPGPP
jgi:ADP-ribose pyrophosphatase